MNKLARPAVTFFTYLESVARPLIVALGFALLAAITALDAATGTRVSVSIFYLIPVSVLTWYNGRGWGIGASLGSAVCGFWADRLGVARGAHLAIPLWNSGARLAMLLVVVHLLAALREVLLALRHQVEREKRLSLTDHLTGLANLRAFCRAGESEISRSHRNGRPLGILYFDLDNFKHVNDTLGHLVGDELLHAVGGALGHALRASDLAARIGGDEFAILLPEIEPEGGGESARRLVASINEEMRRRDWPVTVSAGMVVYRKPPASVNDMIRAADRLMYEVKLVSKNDLKIRVAD